MGSTECTYGSSCTLTTNAFTRSSATFKGWSTSSTATSATYGDRANVTNMATSGTVTLYAVWEVTTTVYTSCPSSSDLFGSAQSNTCNSSVNSFVILYSPYFSLSCGS